MATFADLNAVRDEMNTIIEMVTAPNFAVTVRSTLSEFEYQGLNVLGIVKEIYRRGAAQNRTAAMIRSDIQGMIILFLCRGNNVDKMLLKTNDAGRTRIGHFKERYALANNVGRGGNTTLTLSRIAAVFPVVTLRILSMEDVSIPRAVTLPVADFGSNFPKAMQTVIAAAVFPDDEMGVSLMRALLLYLIEENKLLSNTAGQTDLAILNKVLPFARASFVSSIVPKTDRFSVCVATGLLTETGGLRGSLGVAENTFVTRYQNFDLSFIA